MWAAALALLVPLAQAPAQPAAAAAPHLTAADPPPPSVRIDVVVRDRNGRLIGDLRPQDFELQDNGVAQKIAAVERRVGAPAALADSTPIRSGEDEERAAREPGTRVFAIVLDEFHVSPGAATERVRAALTHFIEHNLRPSDLAVVFKPLDSVTVIRFTRDRPALTAAIASFAGRKGDYTPRTPFEQQYIGSAESSVVAARAQIATAALRELAIHMGELNADRGVMLLVSEGFDRALASARQTRLPDLQGVVRAASRFHLVVYTVNPADPPAPAAADGAADRELSTLTWLAAQTGGTATLDGAAMDRALGRMAEDLDVYYALTYQPAKADGRFHAVDVRAKRKDAQVLARPGYWAPLASELRAMTSRPAGRIPSTRRTLRRSPAITAWTGLTRDEHGRIRLVLTWEPRSRDARTVIVHARTEAGVPLFDGPLAPIGAGGAVPDSVRFDAPAGRIQVDLDIRSITGAAIDSDERDIDVPDLAARKGPVILTPEIVRAGSARQYRALIAAADAAPAGSRVFTRGDRLLIRVPVWEGTSAPVAVTVTVANQWGQSMREVDRAASAGAGVPQFDLPLSWLAPGEYLLEFVGKSATGEARERIAFTVAR